MRQSHRVATMNTTLDSYSLHATPTLQSIREKAQKIKVKGKPIVQ